MRPAPRRPLAIHYLEDDVRTQFFKDHPFEAFRPRSLVEDAEVEGENPVRGENWTRLRQRGRNPTPEEYVSYVRVLHKYVSSDHELLLHVTSAIRFAVNLHEYHNVPITHAYLVAVAQFRALRSEHEVASRVALLEADYYGLQFGPSHTQRTFDEEQKVLQSWSKDKQADAMANTARKRWRMIPERVGEPGSWTRGEEYTRLWQEGVRPSYAPTVASTVITSAGLETTQGVPPVAPPSSPPPILPGAEKTQTHKHKKHPASARSLADILPAIPR